MFSIRGFLMTALVTVIIVSGVLLLFGTYHTLYHELDEQYDAELVQSGRLMASFWRDGHMPDPSVARLDASEHRYQRYFVYQMWRQGSLVLASDGAPCDPLVRLEDIDEGGRYQEVGGWHAYAVPLSGDRWVVVAESDAARRSLVKNMAATVLVPYALSVPVVLLLIWLAVRRGLMPLTRLAGSVAARDADNLAPVPHRAVRELAPLTEAINSLLARLVDTLDREKRFTADAAHELRTLLMALRLHTENAIELADPQEVAHSLGQLRLAIDRATRTVEQLMTLSRLDPALSPRQFPRCHGDSVVRDTLALMLPLAEQFDHHLEADLEPDLDVLLPEEMLQIVLRNLIDNACRYSVRGSRIVVSGYRSGNQIVFLIIDGGPGLTPDEQLKFSGRFSRGRHDVAGAGLGLSIVERILALAGGSLSYRPATQELPAAAELRLPAA